MSRIERLRVLLASAPAPLDLVPGRMEVVENDWQEQYRSRPATASEEATALAAWLAMAALLDVAEAARETLAAMAADPCDCMAHRSPPELLRAALDRLDAS